jgi:hypothetical protein
MTEKIFPPGVVHIASSKQDENIPEKQFQFCPKCGEECEQGFGLAGGGYGVYSYCPLCERVVGKFQCDV